MAGILFAPLFASSDRAFGEAYAHDEQRLLSLVNHARAHPRQCGTEAFPAAAPLQWSGALFLLARDHSLDMADRGFFDHTTPDGVSAATRMKRSGYAYKDRAENIALSAEPAERVIQEWLDSPGHCSNIMERGFKEMGLARAPASRFSHPGFFYWTMTLATPAKAQRVDRR